MDPRYDAFRGDLADVALAGRLFTPHYAAPLSRKSGKSAPILAEPREEAEVLGQLDSNGGFALLDVTAGWAWGYRADDHLVGYVRADIFDGLDGS